jgi:hypothetical protein
MATFIANQKRMGEFKNQYNERISIKDLVERTVGRNFVPLANSAVVIGKA